MSGDPSGDWYWCLRHKRPEEAGDACPADDRMGPYPSREDALAWREKAESREESWTAEDRRWEGESDS